MKVRPNTIVVTALALTLVLWVAHRAAARWYFGPRDEIRSLIDRGLDDIDRFNSALRQRGAIDERLQAYADRTLGPDRETVDHRLRARLNELIRVVGIEQASVNTGRPTERGTPARQIFKRDRALREAVDFVELQAWMSVEGTLEQAVRLAHLVRNEPWLKHIDQLKFDPRDNGARVTMTLRLTTLFMPGHAPSTAELPPPTEEGLDRYEAVVHVNPFRLPVKEQAPAPPPTPTAAPSGFPYSQWELTGLASGIGGVEVWLRNHTTGETRVLTAEQRIGDMEFIEATGDDAVFMYGEQPVTVRVGRKLHDRSPLQR